MSNNFKSLSSVICCMDQILNELLINKDPLTLYGPINYLFNKKGKHTRGLLALLSYNLFSNNIYNIKPLILAIESLHTFTLIHDDVMDNALLRRGSNTINSKWSDNQAILSGDVLLIYAYTHLLSSKKNSQILTDFTSTARKICEGQQLDIDLQKKTIISLDDYYHMIHLKTGVLITFSLVSAASLTKSGKMSLELLTSIGNDIGKLFQIFK